MKNRNKTAGAAGKWQIINNTSINSKNLDLDIDLTNSITKPTGNFESLESSIDESKVSIINKLSKDDVNLLIDKFVPPNNVITTAANTTSVS